MKRFSAPKLENRRTADFEQELSERAGSWLPTWNQDGSAPDFGRALLKIAARFSSEVAERLDSAGDKMALGFLDWLGMKSEAARPARVPVAFKLTETATMPVTAPHPVKMQADAGDDTVTFETEADLRIVPGTIEIVVGVDPASDQFYLPPPGIASLDPHESLPTQWGLKSFTAAGSATLQLDPGLGLSEGMIADIAGAQYEVRKVQDDLVTVTPQISPDGLDKGTVLNKVATFRPFGGACNRQEHVLYIGDPDLLDLEAAGSIELSGPPEFVDGVTWEYWGKEDKPQDPADTDARWRKIESAKMQGNGSVLLTKPKGAVEETQVGTVQARWIRARRGKSDVMTSADGVELRINPLAGGKSKPDEIENVDWEKLLRPEVFVNSTSSPSSNFYPLGREPRMFDTLYLGSDEAFSKVGATAWVQFDLADSMFQSMSGLNTRAFGYVLAAIDARGALHLLNRTISGNLVRLRDPLEPKGTALLGAIAPVMWVDAGNLHVAVASTDQVHVRIEAWPDVASSKWLMLGTPPFNASANAPIAGLAVVNWNNQARLVALRDKKLSTRAANATTPGIWDPKTVEDAATQASIDIQSIVQVRHAALATLPTRLLALSDGADLYDIGVAATANKLISNIAVDVRPCGLEDNADLEVVAVNSAHTKLLAQRASLSPAQPVNSPAFDAGVNFFPHTTISGRAEGGHLAAYLVVKDRTPAGQSLVSWQPFVNGRDDILFQRPTGPGVSELQGTSVLAEVPGLDGYLFLPGSQRGEVYSALLGNRTIIIESRNNLRSALAVSPPANVAAGGDTIGYEDANGNFVLSTVEGASVRGLGDQANAQFFWINPWRNLPTTRRPVWIFGTSVAVPPDHVDIDGGDPTKVTFPTVPVPSRIVVRNAQGSFVAVAITGTPGSHDATADPPFPAAAQGTSISYWAPTELRAVLYPALVLSGANSNSLTTDMFSDSDLHFPDLRPPRQSVIAYEEDGMRHPLRLVFGTAWQTPPAVQNFRLAVDQSVTSWAQVLGDSTANPALSWEYWNGASWWHLSIELADDETNSLRNSGTIKFTVPVDLQAVEWAGKTSHWIRARLIGGDYGRENVTVVSEPGPGANQTTQTVHRTTEGIQPPYALNVGIAYAIDKWAPPQFLLTKDSGMLRDQSDANRTPGANIEVFTPLRVTLGRLDGIDVQGDREIGSGEPGCNCVAEASSQSSAKPDAAGTGVSAATSDTASRSAQPALYVGLNSRLLGAPVNILFAVDREGAYDKMAPLRVDALIGSRFVPIVAPDDTRALGETGLIKMAFPIEPTKAELFGQSPLTWLRMTPSVIDGTWNPSLSGVYLNTVWARAAETMTRELVGPSSGEPNLTLSLARPPVLQNSLELRVREPLGEEERRALLEKDPNNVKYAIADLPGDWVLWGQVPDTVDCSSTDRVYALDETTGTIRFGDGRHGMIPPTGQDAIVAFRYERADAGTDGAVPANQLAARSELNLVTSIEGVETIRAADSSAGGVPTESPQRVLQFAPARLRHRGRAVTAADFESLVQERSDQVVQARCVARGGRIRLVTVMRGKEPAPNRAQQRELRRMLLAVAPPVLASPGALTIEGPNVRRMRVDLKLAVATLDVAANVSDAATKRVLAFFDTESGGANGEGWPLGLLPREEDIAVALLDIANLDSITDIKLVEIHGEDKERPWPAAIRPDELAMLAGDGVRVSFETKEPVL